jgi:hypothetical protein
MDVRFTHVLVSLALALSGAVYASPQAPAPQAPPSAPKPAQSESTVLLLGDSLLATGFGEYLQRRLDDHPQIRCVRRAQSSSGLSRPDFFDWMEAGRQEIDRHQPDAVIVILGGNDGQGITERDGKAVARWGEATWASTYRQRLESFLQIISAPGRRIVWLELPTTGLGRFERKLGLIRNLQREVLSARADAVHLETRPFFIDDKGKALVHAKVEGFRGRKRLRLNDGIHFTVAGGRYFASKVHPQVLTLLGLLSGSAQGPLGASGKPASGKAHLGTLMMGDPGEGESNPPAPQPEPQALGQAGG